ncbi:MOSC domain-containing protein [Flavobacteriaceae bacterium TP-CH-4]|uniref:MOSC domain-containing protein n=1 Tax=Pelagihabitans pacificus TaxID=2696054 RepID=A0A967APT0_9FLAO|nr:MOSC domain-containing protein [Pelagihabitans pacificus]NHF58103.1 MOSC domain-containing protein [Pelagihabitans pacificus]
MKVIATNLGNPTTFQWNGAEERTGIFKYPVDGPLYLTRSDVSKDTVIDRKHHGGVNKACYLFSKDHYPYWKGLYPQLKWDWGMFGENLTIEGMDEATMRIGDIYSIGTALVQVSQPREPCYKLGVRFSDQQVLRQFIEHGYSGTYVRILEEGEVKTGDEVQLVGPGENSLTVKQFFELLYAKQKSPEMIRLALDNPSVPAYKKERFKKFLS